MYVLYTHYVDSRTGRLAWVRANGYHWCSFMFEARQQLTNGRTSKTGQNVQTTHFKDWFVGAKKQKKKKKTVVGLGPARHFGPRILLTRHDYDLLLFKRDWPQTLPSKMKLITYGNELRTYDNYDPLVVIYSIVLIYLFQPLVSSLVCSLCMINSDVFFFFFFFFFSYWSWAGFSDFLLFILWFEQNNTRVAHLCY